MSPLLFAAIAAQVPLAVPAVTVDRCGTPVRLEAEVTEIGPNTLVAEYERPAPTLPIIVDDRTSSALAVSVPTITYDQPLALRNARTGEVTEYPDILEHHRPRSVVTEIRTDESFVSTATDVYVITDDGAASAGTDPNC